MARKKFNISGAIGRGLTEAISIAENGAGIFRNTVVPLSRIELDPENPRNIRLTLHDLPYGPQKNDPLYLQKQAEFEKLTALAKTIETRGLIQPIAVYKQGELYRVAAGHRRCLACIILGKKEIEARVFNEKPNKLELKLVQLIENTAREDLSLQERMHNIKEIVTEYQEKTDKPITAEILHNITGVSLTLAKYHLSILNAPADVLDAINEGRIQNLEKAALIANLADGDARNLAIKACYEGMSKEEFRQLIHNLKRPRNPLKSQLHPRGRGAIRANMGHTKKTQVIQTIVNAVLTQPSFKRYESLFQDINWASYHHATKAFKQLVAILEDHE